MYIPTPHLSTALPILIVIKLTFVVNSNSCPQFLSSHLPITSNDLFVFNAFKLISHTSACTPCFACFHSSYCQKLLHLRPFALSFGKAVAQWAFLLFFFIYFFMYFCFACDLQCILFFAASLICGLQSPAS
jgi:hypothetical protein